MGDSHFMHAATPEVTMLHTIIDFYREQLIAPTRVCTHQGKFAFHDDFVLPEVRYNGEIMAALDYRPRLQPSLYFAVVYR